MKNNIWKDIKWLWNYMVSIIMYAIISVLILIGIILFVYFIDFTKRAKSDVWEPPLYGAYVIVSGSMKPLIKVRDAIVIKRVEDSNIEVGDVITYKSVDPSRYGIMITHRVVEIVKEDGVTKYITKGDNNVSRDPKPISRDQIYGEVVMRIPKVGYLQYFLATSYGWIIAVVAPCLGIIIYDIMKLLKTMRNNRRNNKRRNREIKNEE